MFRNTMPRYDILSPDAIGVLDKGWRRIVSEIGVQFAKPEAVELFRAYCTTGRDLASQALAGIPMTPLNAVAAPKPVLDATVPCGSPSAISNC